MSNTSEQLLGRRKQSMGASPFAKGGGVMVNTMKKKMPGPPAKTITGKKGKKGC